MTWMVRQENRSKSIAEKSEVTDLTLNPKRQIDNKGEQLIGTASEPISRRPYNNDKTGFC